MATDVNAVSEKVRATLATKLSAADADFWARRIAWALKLTAEFASAGTAVAAVSGRLASDTSDADAVEVGLTTLSREPE